jgi:transcriptional regulator with XRE-family HTH domain
MKDPLELKPKVVAGNIRKIREYRNYTQDYLAAKLSISQNAYSKIELGYSKITLDRLFQIAIILDIEVMQLICVDHRVTVKLDPPSNEGMKVKSV